MPACPHQPHQLGHVRCQQTDEGERSHHQGRAGGQHGHQQQDGELSPVEPNAERGGHRRPHRQQIEPATEQQAGCQQRQRQHDQPAGNRQGDVIGGAGHPGEQLLHPQVTVGQRDGLQRLEQRRDGDAGEQQPPGWKPWLRLTSSNSSRQPKAPSRPPASIMGSGSAGSSSAVAITPMKVPPLTPSSSGLAMGLLLTRCSRVPASASSMPHRPPGCAAAATPAGPASAASSASASRPSPVQTAGRRSPPIPAPSTSGRQGGPVPGGGPPAGQHSPSACPI